MNFGAVVAWESGLSNVELYRFAGRRYVKKPGSSERCHAYDMNKGRKQGAKSRGMKGGRRVRKVN